MPIAPASHVPARAWLLAAVGVLARASRSSRGGALQAMRDRITFEQADAFEVVQRYADDANAFFFVDPPYTAGGKKAGARLYTHNEIDHEGLFALMASVRRHVSDQRALAGIAADLARFSVRDGREHAVAGGANG